MIAPFPCERFVSVKFAAYALLLVLLFCTSYPSTAQTRISEAFEATRRGTVLLQEGKLEDAIREFSEAISLDSEFFAAYSRRGHAYIMAGAYELGMKDLNDAISLNPTEMTYTDRCAAHYMYRQYESAFQDCNQAIRLDPLYHIPYNFLAWMMATANDPRLRNGKIAVEYALKACGLMPWIIPGHFDTLAAAYAEVGNFEEAIRWQEKALGFPDFPKDELAGARRRLGLYRASKPYREE